MTIELQAVDATPCAMRFLLVVSSLFVLACSGTAPCSTTCTGCCDARGQCKTLTDSSSCGRAGAACTSCSIGQSCVSGACMSGGFGAGTSGTGGGVGGSGGGVGGSGGGAGGSGGGVGGSGGGVGGTGGGMTATGGGMSGTGGGASGVDCTRLAVQVPTGGCTLSLTAPANCDTVSLAGGFIELAWSTSQTFCEGPHKLYVGGSPISTWANVPPNALEFTLSTGTYTNYAMTRNIGGYFLLTQQDLARLSAVNGQYYFRVASFHDSLSELNTFIVR